MKIGLWSENSNLFDYKQGRDGYTFRWYVLKQCFLKQKMPMSLFNSCQKSSKFNTIIENGIQFCKHSNKYLLMIESPHVRPQDWNKKEHENYKKIFTWDDNLVDNKKYFKLNYAFDLPKSIPKKFEGKKLCCTIAGNKNANHPNELYTKRVELIRWFEKYHLDEFDLYGVGWDRHNFGKSLIGKALNRIKFLGKLFAPTFPSYKGKVESKFETMKNYKFSICYENIKDQNGYLTEKIFDSFFAGCIPVYWGAKNITKYIPKDCFIDKRDFASFEEIYELMKNMDRKTYEGYINAIESFLTSHKADPFRAETFANTIVDEMLKDME